MAWCGYNGWVDQFCGMQYCILIILLDRPVIISRAVALKYKSLAWMRCEHILIFLLGQVCKACMEKTRKPVFDRKSKIDKHVDTT